jgi:hypothetical protein
LMDNQGCLCQHLHGMPVPWGENNGRKRKRRPQEEE